MRPAALLLLYILLPLPALALTEPEEGVSISGDWRLRTEYLRDSFRLVAPAADTVYLSRLQLALRYGGSRWLGAVEIQDSRAWSFDTRSPLGTDDVNSLEPIELWLGYRRTLGGGQLEGRVGRMSVDFGSRRLLARNNFRNTSNALQGAMLHWRRRATRLQFLYSHALQREPQTLERSALKSNRSRLDDAGRDERFWALTAETVGPLVLGSAQLETYLFGAERKPDVSRLRSGRDLFTAGARLRAKRESLSLELEGAYQWGESQGSASPAAPWLDHEAWFMHAGLFWEPESAPASLSLGLVYDHATGDRDPQDGRNGRFDRLYGARAFELGPSGIFGAAIRSNLRSPALRLRWQGAGVRGQVSYRWLRLDQAADALLTSGRRDRSGASGRDVGEQLEIRARWTMPAPELTFEAGWVWLDKGRFFRGSPGAGPTNPIAVTVDDSQYLYGQLVWRF